MSQPHNSVRVVRWEPDATEGWLLNFAGPRGLFEEELAALKDVVQPWQRVWLTEERAWWIASEAVAVLAVRWRPLRDYLELQHQRGQDEPKAKRRSRRQTSSATPQLPPAILEAFHELCLTPEAPPQLVAAARRVYARLHHPDHAGGNLEIMKRYNVAADTVEQWLAEQQHGASA